jgi:ribosomal protein S28E/S33
MKPGAYEVYEFRIENNNLTLTQRRNVRGPVERGNVWTLTRVE